MNLKVEINECEMDRYTPLIMNDINEVLMEMKSRNPGNFKTLFNENKEDVMKYIGKRNNCKVDSLGGTFVFDCVQNPHCQVNTRVFGE